jgi:hypothetical protein
MDASKLELALDEIGREVGISLSLGPEGYETFLYQDHLPVLLHLTPDDRFVTAAIIAEDLNGEDPRLLRKLLSLSWLGLGTGGAGLSWNEESNSLALWLSAPIEELTAGQVRNQLENLLKQALHLREILGEAGEPSGAAPSAHAFAPSFSIPV